MIGAALIVLLVGALLLYGKGRAAGERAVRAEWQEASDKAEAEYRAREASLRQQAVTLTFELQDIRAANTTLQKDLQHALSRGTLIRTVPGKCPAPATDFERLWNLAANPPPGSSGPR